MSDFQRNENFLKAEGKNIQAHIFSPHKKDHASFLFLNFSYDSEDKNKITSFFNSFGDLESSLRITSVDEQDLLSKNGAGASGGPVFVNVYLTGEGLEYFDCNGEGWDTIIHNLKSKTKDLSTHKALNKSVKQEKVIHAMVLLAHKDKVELESKQLLFMQYFKRYNATLIKEERGRVYRQKMFATQERGFVVEHFGYADGLSNPWFIEKDGLLKNGTPKSRNKWDPTASVHDFIIPEPSDSTANFGSYLVYRKFEQNVKEFKRTMKILSDKTGYEKDEVGAFVFGRTKNGTPVELQNNGAAIPEEGFNDFKYETKKCPLFAHTKKANPRTNNEISMIRRGITYGERAERKSTVGSGYELDDKLPEKEVGLLFFSFLNDINKFQEVLDRSRSTESEVDPILGYINDSDKMTTHTFKRKPSEGSDGNQEEPVPYRGMKGLVHLEEGINLYMPSIRFFETLGLEKKKDLLV